MLCPWRQVNVVTAVLQHDENNPVCRRKVGEHAIAVGKIEKPLQVRQFPGRDKTVHVGDGGTEIRSAAAMQRHGAKPVAKLLQRRQPGIGLYLAVAFDDMQVEALEKQRLPCNESCQLPEKRCA